MCRWKIFRTGKIAEVSFKDLRTEQNYDVSSLDGSESDFDIINWIVDQCGAGDNDSIHLSNGTVVLLDLGSRAVA